MDLMISTRKDDTADHLLGLRLGLDGLQKHTEWVLRTKTNPIDRPDRSRPKHLMSFYLTRQVRYRKWYAWNGSIENKPQMF